MASFPSVLVSSTSVRGGEELEDYSEDPPSFTALGNTRGLRARIMPHRRAPSRTHTHPSPPGHSRGSPVGKRLMAECKVMLRKNQSWLSMEDLTSPPATPEVEEPTTPTLGMDRRSGTLLNTIPDSAPVTLTKGRSHSALDPPADSAISTSSSAAPVFNQEQERDTGVGSGFTYALESSGTLTPSSDATLSPGQSVEVLSSSPAASATPSPRKDSASFAMHRGDSVDGLFMSSSPVSSPPEPQDVAAPPSMARQSPFRRQLFTSLLTHQSALVSRVNQHSNSLLKVVGAVRRFTQRETTPPTAHSTPTSPQETPTSSLGPHGPPRSLNVPRPAPQEPEEGGEEAWLWGDLGEQIQEAAVPFFERVAGRRQLSMCDSGLGFETDDDLASSLSRSSTYTTSEDGEEMIDREGKCARDEIVTR